jgi:CRISPR-associated protein Cas4
VAGSHVHRNVDAPSKLDDPKELGLPEGSKLRSLRLESESLGLIGVVDIVEGGPDGAEIIDYKKGSARRDAEGERVAKEPDAMQVAAHALLLREHGVNAVRGAIFYAADKRRVPVEFTEELFSKVRKAIDDARAVAASGKCPPPLKNDARCLYCSAYPICLPNESLWWSKRRKPADTDGQIQFGFIAQSEDAVRSQILAALDFAAESTDKEPTLQPPRPGGDDGEVLVRRRARKSASAAMNCSSASRARTCANCPANKCGRFIVMARFRLRRRRFRRAWNWALTFPIFRRQDGFSECWADCQPAAWMRDAVSIGCLKCRVCACNWHGKSSAPKFITNA